MKFYGDIYLFNHENIYILNNIFHDQNLNSIKMDQARLKYPKYIGITDNINNDVKLSIKSLDRENFINTIRIIGYAIGTLSNFDILENDYNTTDCITTNKSLHVLFQPTLIINYSYYSNQANELKLANFIKEYNFINVTVRGFDYHRFILIKLTNNWYIMDSFADVYTLRIDIIEPYNLLTNFNINVYQFMFSDVNTKSDGYIKLELKIGLYDINYKLRLMNWLNNRLN